MIKGTFLCRAALVTALSVAGCTTQPLTDAIEGLTEAIDNAPAPTAIAIANSEANATSEGGDVSQTDTSITIVPPPATQPAPQASDLNIPIGALSYIVEDTSGVVWTLTAGTWDGAFHPNLLDGFAEDWRHLARTTHTLTLYDLGGNAITLPPLTVEGAIDAVYAVDPNLYDLTQGCLQTTLRLKNSISGNEADVQLPESCR